MSTVHIDRLLETAVRAGATDLWLVPGRSPVIARLHAYRMLETAALSPTELRRLAAALLPEPVVRQAEERGSALGVVAFGDKARFRVTLLRHDEGLALMCRMQPPQPPSLGELGLPQSVSALSRRPHGLLAVAGLRSSGRTRSWAALVRAAGAADRATAVLAPVHEFLFRDSTSLALQHEFGSAADLTTRIADVRRAGVDLIVIDGLEDNEALDAALDAAADTLVIAVVRGRDTVDVLGRLADPLSSRPAEPHATATPAAAPESPAAAASPTASTPSAAAPDAERSARRRTLLSSRLAAVLTTALLPRKDGGGLAQAWEVFVHTPESADPIRTGRFDRVPGVIQTGRKLGMVLLDESLWDLYQRRIVTGDSALARACDPVAFHRRLQADRGDGPDDPPSDFPGGDLPAPSPAWPINPDSFLSAEARPDDAPRE